MKTWQRMVSLLVLALVVFAASSALAAELDQEVLYHVNIMRVNAGVAPLALNRELAAASYVRAAEAEVNFAHRRPDGREVKSVFANASFAWFGENLAVSKKADADAIESLSQGEIDALNAQLADMEAENEQLRKELEEAKKQK